MKDGIIVSPYEKMYYETFNKLHFVQEEKWNCENLLRAKDTRIAELEAALEKYGVHDRDCILSFWEGGEPTADGGYRSKITGIWYQTKPVDETPKCNCGLQEALQKTEGD